LMSAGAPSLPPCVGRCSFPPSLCRQVLPPSLHVSAGAPSLPQCAGRCFLPSSYVLAGASFLPPCVGRCSLHLLMCRQVLLPFLHVSAGVSSFRPCVGNQHKCNYKGKGVTAKGVTGRDRVTGFIPFSKMDPSRLPPPLAGQQGPQQYSIQELQYLINKPILAKVVQVRFLASFLRV
jgi:hypothetical protein